MVLVSVGRNDECADESLAPLTMTLRVFALIAPQTASVA